MSDVASQQHSLREILLTQLAAYAQRGVAVDDDHRWLVAHKNHLRLHLPRRYAMLEEEGVLHLSCQVAATRAVDQSATMIAAGERPDVADEYVRHQIIYPMSEEERDLQLAELQAARRDAQEDQATLLVNALRR